MSKGFGITRNSKKAVESVDKTKPSRRITYYKQGNDKNKSPVGTNSETNLKELDLDQKSNLTMLMDLGDELKPSIYRWDDYYSMYMIFNKFFKKNKEKLSEEEFFLIISYIEKCKEKINSNSYSILK
jgi:hypothetical protein